VPTLLGWGVKAMLQKLADHIASSYALAVDCEERAKQAPDEASRTSLLEMATAWRHVARSYEFVESLERFLIDAHKNGQLVNVQKLPKMPLED
jgi:hypothetical protein